MVEVHTLLVVDVDGVVIAHHAVGPGGQLSPPVTVEDGQHVWLGVAPDKHTLSLTLVPVAGAVTLDRVDLTPPAAAVALPPLGAGGR